MKKILTILFALLNTFVCAESYTWLTHYEYAPAAGRPGSTAIHQSSASFVGWADGYTDLIFGEDVTAYKDPTLALGPAVGGSYDVLCLGRGGEVVFTFSAGVRDGNGADFAVFENGFNDYFLELAYVEVSSDGTNFVRFPNYSLNVPGGQLLATRMYGLAGKYREGYGTPFDLNELKIAHQAALDGNTDFSVDFTAQLTNGFPFLDFENIAYIRLVDVINNDATCLDSRGETIADPAAQTGTAGFDLDAIGVINRSAMTGVPQAIEFGPIPHQKMAFQTLELSAMADSGLPVAFSVQSGPATNSGSLLYFTGTGTVEVVANQGGDTVYAPAPPVLRSFRVADEVQHIFVEPVPDQPPGVGYTTLRAYSSSGLPVLMEVHDGPDSILIGPTNHVLTLSGDTGDVIVRAYQPGDAVTAPAEDVFVRFRILNTAEAGQLVSFPDWLHSNSVPELVLQPLADGYGRAAFRMEYSFDSKVQASSRVLQSLDLVTWSNAIPEMLEMTSSNVVLQLTAEKTNCFYRLEFEGQ